jgi:hypothetical protein
MEFTIISLSTTSFVMHVIVCGDDSVVAWSDGVTIQLLDIDYAKYDRTQHKGVLRVQRKRMQLLALKARVIGLLKRSTAKQASFYSKTSKSLVRLYAALERATGNADTTFGNGTNNMNAIAYGAWTVSKVDPEGLIRSIEEVGFDCTYTVYDGPLIHQASQATFLSGIWWPATDGLAWGPIPGAVVKLGKILEREKELDFEDLRVLAYGQGMNMAQHVDVPIFRSLRDSLLRLGLDDPIKLELLQKVVRAKSDMHKPTRSQARDLDWTGAMQAVNFRYGPIDVTTMELLFAQVVQIPQWVSHPHFRTMSTRDYG